MQDFLDETVLFSISVSGSADRETMGRYSKLSGLLLRAQNVISDDHPDFETKHGDVFELQITVKRAL